MLVLGWGPRNGTEREGGRTRAEAENEALLDHTGSLGPPFYCCTSGMMHLPGQVRDGN